MSKELTIINVIWAVADTIVCGLSIAACTWMSVTFDRWWIFLFSIIPLAVFSKHTYLFEKTTENMEEGENDNEG